MVGAAVESCGDVKPAMVARTRVNGAFVRRDICMQTKRRRERESGALWRKEPLSNGGECVEGRVSDSGSYRGTLVGWFSKKEVRC